ncbi:hypothetical protein [Sinomonas atrocyanea]|uniref:hypothetical protein n=1 Tax=Sinomonas atrocyanea TaxID=37927 RepID=UPI0011434B76|nr:hypothetical protein [Sinomonas atrocyanea]
MTESPTIPETQRCSYQAELNLHQTSFMSRCELGAGHRGGHLAELPTVPGLAVPALKPSGPSSVPSPR